MVYLSTYALVFFWIPTTQPEEGLASEQAIFERNEQNYLADHVFETTQANNEVEYVVDIASQMNRVRRSITRLPKSVKVDVSSTIGQLLQLKRHLMLMTKYTTQNSTI